MAQTYQYLLTLDFQHNYFGDGQFKSLQVSFDQETTQLLKQLGVILKPFPGGVHFLVADPELLANQNQKSPIRLFLDCRDTYFINYTELPTYRPSDTVLYFNNLNPIPNSEGTGLQLQSEAYIGQKEVVPMSFGKWTPSNFDPEADYQFEDVFGNDISHHINQAPNGSNQFIILNRAQGSINIMDDGHLEERLYYYPKPVWKKPLGIVEIYPPALFDQFHTNGKQTYSLNFDTRHTIWKYFLVDPVYKKFDDLSIIDRNKEVVFHPPQKQQVQEAEALVFESIHKIAISEFSEDNFQLVDQFDTTIRSGKVVLQTLPRASPEQLYREDTLSTGTLYSHIYI